MNWDKLEGQWHQVKGSAKSNWAKLTDDDMKNVGGKKEALLGALQERYGILKDEAEKQANEWLAQISPNAAPKS